MLLGVFPPVPLLFHQEAISTLTVCTTLQFKKQLTTTAKDPTQKAGGSSKSHFSDVAVILEQIEREKKLFAKETADEIK